MQTSIENTGHLLSGEQVYDAIMKVVDTDLLSSALSHLKEKYANETPEEKAARLERYKKSFAEYDRRFAIYVETLHEQIQSKKRSARQAAEEKSRAEDARIQAELLSQMSTS